MMSFVTYSQSYDFTGEIVGTTPANVSLGYNGITTNDGTVEVSTYNTTDRGMEITNKGTLSTAIVDLSLFPSDNDYSIIWKETFTTGRRSGFVLRANGACTSLNYKGMKQGYLFQVNSNSSGGYPNSLKIYELTGSSVTTVGSEVALTNPGINTPRWYRATVCGNSLIFAYSDDASNWVNLISETDNTHTSGSVQYSQGYGDGVGGLYVDEIIKTAAIGTFSLSQTSLAVSENSGTGTFTAELNSQPVSDVVIDFSSANTNKVTVSPSSYTFTSGNWDTPQIITVTGVNDDVAANSQVIILASVNDALSDDEFDFFPDCEVLVSIINDDIPTVIYDFESPDVVNNSPLNITAANGTSKVVTGQAMNILTLTSGNIAVFTLDSISSSATNYTVSWKENYSTAGRSGVILRGTGANTVSNGLMQGYLIQVSPNFNHARIYTSNSTDFTQLIETSLTAPGVGVDRWYRATVEGSTISFDYSDDGTNFTFVHSITNTVFQNAGATQFVRGFGSSVTGSQIDDIGTFADDQLQITNIDPFQIFQRDELGNADILIEGIYKGTPTGIEARWNGAASWTSLTKDANGAGTFSGILTNQYQGQGTLEVRYTNDNLIANTKENIGIGDIFIIAGQSNASGRGNTLNNYTHGSLKATLFGNDDNWKNLADSVDGNANQVDGVSSDAASGSPWPLIATSIMASEGIPVAFVPTPKGGTSIQQWQPGSNHTDASTLYGSMNRRISAVGGAAKGILFFQGESDASAGTSQANYVSRLNTFINTAISDFSGLKTMVGQIGESNYAGNNNIRAAQIYVSHANTNALLGPVTYDIDLTVDNLHFITDVEMVEFARRWYKAIDREFYSGANGYGPIVDETNASYDAALNKVTITFTDNTSPVIDPASTVAPTSFILKNSFSTVGISAVVISGSTIEITPSASLNTAQSITLTYASLNTGVNKAIYDIDGLPAENFYDINIQLGNTWTGAISTDWHTAGNWSAGIIPTLSDIVIIPDVANDPIVSTSAMLCGAISVYSGASLTINIASSLNGDVNLEGVLNLSGASLDLNGQTINFGSNALLNESGGNSLTGNTGSAIITKILNAPTSVNPGNLGVTLTAPDNLGSTTIKRGHWAYTGNGSSISRYYDISPRNDYVFNATLVFHYEDSELNGITEENLTLFQSVDNGITWTKEGGTLDTTNNTVTLSGITSFSRWTLADKNVSLPIELTSFNATLVSNQMVLLEWVTASEFNNSHFVLLRTNDLNNWEKIKIIGGAGNSNNALHYSFIDNKPFQGVSYYRLVQVDYDGHSESMKIVSVNNTNKVVQVAISGYPNPTRNLLNITGAFSSSPTIRVFNALGKDYSHMVSIVSKSNQLIILSFSELPKGIYIINIDGKLMKAIIE